LEYFSIPLVIQESVYKKNHRASLDENRGASLTYTQVKSWSAHEKKHDLGDMLDMHDIKMGGQNGIDFSTASSEYL
jgi:hypothetical protein